MRPSTTADLDMVRRTAPRQRPKWPWAEMASVPGRSFTLEVGRDYEAGKEYAPERSARKWAKRRGLTVTIRSNHRLGVMTFVFSPPLGKFDAAIRDGLEWVPCKWHERERASRVGRAYKLRAEFDGERVRFVPRFAGDGADSAR